MDILLNINSFYMFQERPDVPYFCLDQPALLSVRVQKYNFKLPYPEYFGGVVSLTVDQFMLINGMSNR